jgi:hypothetical protein
MGTSSSVVYYAVICMIWLEKPMVEAERFRFCMYKLFIDDLSIIMYMDWTCGIARKHH